MGMVERLVRRHGSLSDAICRRAAAAIYARQHNHAEPGMRFTVDRLDHIVINCRDVEITASWYQRLLGMEREEFGRDRRTALKFGGQKINLRPAESDIHTWITGANSEAGAVDVCFITAVGPEDVVAHLHECGVTVQSGPVPRTGALGPMESVYCRDPDGNLIEIASYL
jgi:catechol 2,3-dioxygenase-like lactoylglutathione lyase family enzyme